MPTRDDDRIIIRRFAGRWHFLCNFHEAPLTVGGHVYPTAEHAFQAAKATTEGERADIAAAPSPRAAKALGRRVALASGWDRSKLLVMLDVLRAKFADEPLRGLLLSTGGAFLEEGNTWGDRTWGAVDGKGLNLLGQSLMVVRAELNAYRRQAVRPEH